MHVNEVKQTDVVVVGAGNAAICAALLGVKAVFAKSFERIHRTNLVCVGVLPCQFVEGRGLEFLNLAGDESFDLKGIDDNIAPQQQAVLRVCRANGETIEVRVILRLDTRRRSSASVRAACCLAICERW
jgi:aconitate hydratase